MKFFAYYLLPLIDTLPLALGLGMRGGGLGFSLPADGRDGGLDGISLQLEIVRHCMRNPEQCGG